MGIRTSWIGSEAHKRLFCDTFVWTHKPFEPDSIRWPDLSAESLARLKTAHLERGRAHGNGDGARGADPWRARA